MWTVISSLVLALALSGPSPFVEAQLTSQSQSTPDFNGRWAANLDKSAHLAGEANSRTAVVVFGEQCVITQTAETLTLDITAGGMSIQAVYRLDGKPAINRSPGAPGQPDIIITSTSQWIGNVLHVTTKSESELDGVMVPVESLRKLWLTVDGDLAVERRGTPARVVSAAWTVYERVK